METIYINLATELKRVGQWVQVNRLSLNIDKTNYMIISNRKYNVKDLQLSGKIINRTNHVKFLGVIIDDKLSFSEHVHDLVKKVSSSTGVLRRVSNLVPVDVRLKIYYALIYSRMTYAITVWGRSSIGNRNLCNSAVKRVWKIIFYNCVRQGANNLELLTYDSMLEYFACLKLCKIMFLNGHNYFRIKMLQLASSHSHETRFNSQSNLNSPFFTKSKCQNSFLYQSVKVWNSIPVEIRNSPSIGVLKKSLKKYITSHQ